MTRTNVILMRLDHVKSVIILGRDLAAVWADNNYEP